MSSQKVTHIGFADESHWNVGRFRSLGLVTTTIDAYEDLQKQLEEVLKTSGVTEFKWKSVSGAKGRFAAQKLCAFAVQHACKNVLRVDVLVWDVENSRHKVPRRDDIANLQRMYYHLFCNVLKLRWPRGAVWCLYPDEHSAMNWQTVQDFLELASESAEVETSCGPHGWTSFRFRLRSDFGIHEIRPVPSDRYPLLQVADLFAGLAVFSREKFHEYMKWLDNRSGQLHLIEDRNVAVRSSQRTEERFEVLKDFDQMCKRHKLGVSLKRSHGLRTLRPKNPINFWLYEPQHPEDKAPVKN